MKILSIECSSLSASAAISESGKITGESYVNVGLTHSQTLMPMVQNVLLATKTDINSVDVFAVTAGPGSFTGVRIGVAALKGLAGAKNKPCFSVSTTEAIAYPLKGFDGVVCSVMDARCSQVYTALFKNGKRLCEDKAILISELSQELKALNENVILAGDGTEMCYEKLRDEIDGLFLSEEQFRFARASSVCLIADEKISNGEKTVASGELLPMYLRLPQAQRELNNKKKNEKGE